VDVEDAIRSALEREARNAPLPQDLLPTVLRRARRRRIFTASVVGIVVVGASVAGVAGVGAVMRDRVPREPATGSPMPASPPTATPPTIPALVPVPDVVGMAERDAVKALAAAGIPAEIRHEAEAPPTGRVLRSDPPAGTGVAPGSFVRLYAAYEPPSPVPGPREEAEWNARIGPLSRLVQASREAFVGMYLDEAGVPVVVFNPGVDPDAWQERLERAAGALAYRTEVCPRSREELERIQAELGRRAWSPNAASIAFATSVSPSTCSVWVESGELKQADLRALGERFGTAVTVVFGGVSRLLGDGGP
jgi:hypothetical protein